MTDMAIAAKTLLRAGFSILPCDGNKKPLVRSWKPYQAKPMTEVEAERCFNNGARLAIIGGAVSGNAECLDIDDPAVYTPLIDMLDMQRPGLAGKLLRRKTPSGGYHIVYRSEKPVAGNLKLASTAAGEVRIETRGEGGYFLSPPSQGYQVLSGSLTSCPVLTPDEIEIIHSTARSFDEQHLAQHQQRTATPQKKYDDAPGKAFNDSHSIVDLLKKYGWREAGRTGAGQAWTRPGKDKGISAVLMGSGNLYVFSSNAAPFEPQQSYSPFAIYTMYEHGGDFSAAARQLAREGYGTSNTRIYNRRAATVPDPLPDELPPVAPFDYELLPDSLRPWVQDICERIQCPPDFVAVGVMTCLATVIGRKVGIRPQSKTDWTVIPNCWGMVIGRPGILKSPALEAALSPLKRLTAEAHKRFFVGMRDYQAAARAAKLKAEAQEKVARKKLHDNPAADVLAVLAVDEVAVPTEKRFISNDPTPASLGVLLIENPNGLLVHRDEIVSLLKSLDREDNAEGRGFYLTGWNGDSAYTIDRIGRGMNLYIEAVCISLLGGTQPGRAAEYIRHAVKGGAGDDGLIQRFGLLVWPDNGGTWKDVDRWPDTAAKNQAFTVFERLEWLDPATIGAQQDNDFGGNPAGVPYLRFAPDALGLFLEWRLDLENRLRSNDLHPALESHFSKYRKLVPALALIIHLAEGSTGPVTRAATLKALAWSEYLESHARRTYGAGAQPAVATAKLILKKIGQGRLSESFSSRDVWRPGWSMLTDREQVMESLKLLIDYGWLWEEQVETGGRRATIYHKTEWSE
jgi:hypothetical protein